MKRTSRLKGDSPFSSIKKFRKPGKTVTKVLTVASTVAMLVASQFAAAEVADRKDTGALLELKGKIYTSAGQAGITGFDGFENYWNIAPEGQKPAIFMDYYDPYNVGPQWTKELKQELLKFHRQGYYVMPQIGLNLDYFYEEIIAGEFDEQLDTFVEGFRYLGIPAFLRVGYEFNHSERHWSPEQYQDVLKVVANKFKQADLEVAMVFNAGLSAAQGVDKYYPGSEYVDWVGYNTFGDIGNGNGMHSIATEMIQLAQKESKPIMIGEAGPNDVNDSQNYAQWGWFDIYFTQMSENPEIKATTYINWDWNNQDAVGGNGLFPWGDGRLQLPGSVAPQFFNELSDSRYFHASSEKDTRSLFFYQDNTAPTKVNNLRRVGDELSWDAATDSGEAGLAHYTIYKDGKLWDYIIGESYPIEDLGAGYTAEITISAMDRAGNEGTASNQLMVDLDNRVEKIWDGEFNLPQTSVALGWRFMGTMDGGAKLPDDGISGNIDTTGQLSGPNSVHLEWDSVEQNPVDWKISLFQAFQVTEGTEYKISFQTVAPKPITVRFKFKDHHNDPLHTWVPSGGADPHFSDEWQVYFEEEIEVTTTPTTHEFTVIAPETETARWSLEMGHVAAAEMYVDAVSVSEGINAADPIADAGSEDRVIVDQDCSTTLNLDGSGSRDSDGEVVSFEWFVDGDSVSTQATDSVNLTCGTYTVTLEVKDNDGNTGSDVFKVTVSDGAPIADAGEDQVVLDKDDSGTESVTLTSGDSIDPDGTQLTYSWASGAEEISTEANPVVELEAGVHNLTLTVKDEDGNTASDQVSITVVPNVAKSAAVSVSSTSEGSAAAIVDGSLESSWVSAEGDDDQWVTVDLGSSLDLVELDVDFVAGKVPKAFDIQVADSCTGNFTTVEAVTDFSGEVLAYPFEGSVTQQCVRLLMPAAVGSDGVYVDSTGNFQALVQDDEQGTFISFDPLKEGMGSNFAFLELTVNGSYQGSLWSPPGDKYGINVQDGDVVSFFYKYTLPAGDQVESDTFEFTVGQVTGTASSSFGIDELRLFSPGTVTIEDKPPVAPTALELEVVSSTTINLTWVDEANNENGYRVTSGGSEIADLGVNSSSYSANGLTAETNYCFEIVAYNDLGDAASDEVCATTQSAPTGGLVYIVHKATGKKVSSCGTIGDKVEMAAPEATDDCAKWEIVDARGKYFFIRSVAADGYIRPRGLSNGIPIMVQPTSWTGNYMQWSTQDTGDGYFHLVNRQTTKFGYTDGDMFLQQSKKWTGDWTRWQFVDVE